MTFEQFHQKRVENRSLYEDILAKMREQGVVLNKTQNDALFEAIKKQNK